MTKKTKRNDDRDAEKKSAHIRMPESFFLNQSCAQTTIGLATEMQRHLYRDLGLGAGDTVMFESPQGRRLVGKLLLKPTDCLLVEEDNFNTFRS